MYWLHYFPLLKKKARPYKVCKCCGELLPIARFHYRDIKGYYDQSCRKCKKKRWGTGDKKKQKQRNFKKSVESLNASYVRSRLKKRGFPNDSIENHELQQTIKLLILTKRLCQSQTSNNSEKA